MATTSPDSALNAVAAIEVAGVSFAILHGEAALVRGEVSSDVDIVSDRPVHDLVHIVAEFWAALGLHPVIVWPYDVGGTGSIFLATSDARDGVQLDVLCDRDGRGRYGARSEVLLRAAEPGQRFPTVSPAERLAYLLAKRIGKGQMTEVEKMIGDHRADPSAGVALDVLRPRMARLVRSLLRDGSTPRWQPLPPIGHLAGRLRRPVGAWVELRGHDAERVASELASRFGRFLPHATCIGAPGIGSWATSVAPIRWRAGIVASHGVSLGMIPQPDVLIAKPTSTDDACRETVRALTLRNLPSEGGP